MSSKTRCCNSAPRPCCVLTVLVVGMVQDEVVHVNFFGLAQAVSSRGRLVFPSGIPPAPVMEHMVGRSDVQAGPRCEWAQDQYVEAGLRREIIDQLL